MSLLVDLVNAALTLWRLLHQRWRRRPPKRPLSRPIGARERDILRLLRRDGIAVVEGYLGAEQCEQLRSEIDLALVARPSAVNTDALGADHRLFGFERISAAARRFHEDPWLRDLAQSYCGTDIVNATTLAAMLRAVPGNLGSGLGWHRDSFAHQVKAMVYLSDVDCDHGPFCYVVRSAEPSDIARAVLGHRFGYLQNRLTDEQVAALLARQSDRARIVTGRAGTLVLANTRGIHRGLPIASGTRYALTNYYYTSADLTEKVLDRFARTVVTVDGQPLVPRS
jgi:hypothetical protein